ncbi:MAG TPA: hypothetical protein VFW68_14095 [Rhodocyclaceae bacterium]|nr:hypothetical protein [Rhodocyclaceae bacterium]
MTDRYCYHCNTRHPESEMRLIESKTGKRWRCVKSIEASKKPKEDREAFGKKATEQNKAESAARARQYLNVNLNRS